MRPVYDIDMKGDRGISLDPVANDCKKHVRCSKIQMSRAIKHKH